MKVLKTFFQVHHHKNFDLRQIKLNSTLKLDRTDLEFVVCWNALSISHFIQYMKKTFTIIKSMSIRKVQILTFP